MTTDHVLRFAGTTAGLDDAVTTLRGILDARGPHPRHRHDVELVFEEVASNIVNYGKPSEAVEAVMRFGDGETTLSFEDDGVAFDPRSQPPPPAASQPSELRIGGLGLVIVRDLCTRVDYVRTPQGRNRLTLAIPVPAEDADPTGELPVVSDPRS